MIKLKSPYWELDVTVKLDADPKPGDGPFPERTTRNLGRDRVHMSGSLITAETVHMLGDQHRINVSFSKSAAKVGASDVVMVEHCEL